MRNLIVAGIGTEVGKTVVSAILTKALQAEYWKPIQAGNLEASDTATVSRLVDDPTLICHPEVYRLKHAFSPHQAAELEGLNIAPDTLCLPQGNKPLIIEGAGGLLVPLTDDQLQLDVYAKWPCDWILVSKHYLGSINHTLLALEALQRRQLSLVGVIFNGSPNPATERIIRRYAGNQVAYLRLQPESLIHSQIIKQYAETWKPYLTHLI